MISPIQSQLISPNPERELPSAGPGAWWTSLKKLPVPHLLWSEDAFFTPVLKLMLKSDCTVPVLAGVWDMGVKTS